MCCLISSIQYQSWESHVIYILQENLEDLCPGLVLKTDYGLMQKKSIAECSNGSILQYFQPSLSYYLSLKSLFCLF